MTIKNRIEKLESAAGIGTRNGYMCVISTGWADGLHTPEEKAKGYKIQPYIKEFGGTGEKPFYLASLEDVKAFGERPDVNLSLIIMGDEQEEFTKLWQDIQTIEPSEDE